jgi:hypothetical protein
VYLLSPPSIYIVYSDVRPRNFIEISVEIFQNTRLHKQQTEKSLKQPKWKPQTSLIKIFVYVEFILNIRLVIILIIIIK